MAKYNVHAGHCPSGKGASGAVGFLNESDEARLVKKEVISELKEIGHKVYDCTCDEKETQNGCLNKIISKCNAHNVDLDVSIHLNSGRNDKKGDGSTGGVEVWVYSKNSDAYPIAKRICKQISKDLGINNRGVKISTSLFVLRRTNSPALLVECCFVDDKDDAEHWNAKKCANAIVKGILNKDVPTSSSDSNKNESDKKQDSNDSKKENSKSNWISELQEECNKQRFSNQKVDGIAGKNTLAGCPTLRKGAKGNITKIMQQRLISLGYSCGSTGADGDFGTNTYNAVKKFQKAKGLTQDGIVGKNTWKKLLGL